MLIFRLLITDWQEKTCKDKSFFHTISFYKWQFTAYQSHPRNKTSSWWRWNWKILNQMKMCKICQQEKDKKHLVKVFYLSGYCNYESSGCIYITYPFLFLFLRKNINLGTTSRIVSSTWAFPLPTISENLWELFEKMQKILQTDDITNTQALRKGKRKRTETMDSENANSDMDKGQVGVLLPQYNFII